MKKKLAGIRVALSICAVFGWWGILYPELTMTPDTYEVIWEEDIVQSEQNMIEWNSVSDMYRMILEAEDNQVRFKSRLLEYLK